MSDEMVEISQRLNTQLEGYDFEPPVEYVYRPLDYAWNLHKSYINKFGASRPRQILLVGMNPGPWGMGQTGVPFGDVDFVGNWMDIQGDVSRPDREHPKKEVVGLDCHRNEVSGSRLWGWAEDRFGAAENFFENFFVHNYCPLLFLEEGGKNRTPNRLKADERREIFPYCDEALRGIVDYLDPEYVVGIGKFATERIRAAYEDKPEEVSFEIGRILHPSPANPWANKGWVERAEDSFEEIGIDLESFQEVEQ